MSSEACVAITRGGVTYRIKKPLGPSADGVVHWLQVGGECYRVSEPVRPENGNAREVPSATALLCELTATLDRNDPDDRRAGAILAVLSAGVRKHELVGLDLGDVRENHGALALCVRRTRKGSRARERMIALGPEHAALLSEYWRREELAARDPREPLFWTLGRHGRCQRTRITGHAVSYWLDQLRRRVGIAKRLTSRSFRNKPSPSRLELAGR